MNLDHIGFIAGVRSATVLTVGQVNVLIKRFCAKKVMIIAWECIIAVCKTASVADKPDTGYG